MPRADQPSAPPRDIGRIAGVVLAGGASRRMGGGDKALRRLAGVPVLQRVIQALGPQCDGLLISANGDLRRFAAWGLPVIGDTLPEPVGPLGGIVAALDWLAARQPAMTHALTVPCDTPFLPPDLAERLAGAIRVTSARFACASSQGRLHPIVALWPVAARGLLRAAVADGRHSLRRALDPRCLASVDWAAAPIDPFFNINDPAAFDQAEQHLSRHGPGPTSA